MSASHDDRDDAALLRAVRRGDEVALGELYDRHAGWLTARLTRRCASSDIVDQALQDTFLAVWRGRAEFRGDGEVGAFLWGVAVRRLIDALRRDPAHRVAPPAQHEPAHRESAQHREALVVSAEDQVLLAVEHGPLGQALATLSPELRAAIEATVLDGLTYPEAAVLLGVPEGTVKSRCHRARAALRAALIARTPSLDLPRQMWETP
jgi:RNA polymerase sigma factor (sigma-70 family)